MVGGKGQLNKRVESVVAECVAHLAVALGKEDLWQKLNYQLLLKTRHKKRYVSKKESLSLNKYIHVYIYKQETFPVFNVVFIGLCLLYLMLCLLLYYSCI